MKWKMFGKARKKDDGRSGRTAENSGRGTTEVFAQALRLRAALV